MGIVYEVNKKYMKYIKYKVYKVYKNARLSPKVVIFFIGGGGVLLGKVQGGPKNELWAPYKWPKING